MHCEGAEGLTGNAVATSFVLYPAARLVGWPYVRNDSARGRDLPLLDRPCVSAIFEFVVQMATVEAN